MRTIPQIRLVLTAALLFGGAALAKREVKEFEAPSEKSQQELDEAKARARNGNINSYNKDVQIKPEPVPWMAIGLGLSVLAAAVPFGVYVFRQTAGEIATANTFGSSGTARPRKARPAAAAAAAEAEAEAEE
ncbi:hypothetical protein P2318_17375 [Myxococcaceae bacterium GXIMD 01537]